MSPLARLTGKGATMNQHCSSIPHHEGDHLLDGSELTDVQYLLIIYESTGGFCHQYCNIMPGSSNNLRFADGFERHFWFWYLDRA